MYIEVFLMDNLLMDMLILDLAAALMGCARPYLKMLAASAAASALAALAAYGTALRSPLLRLPMLILLALALPVKGVRGAAKAALAVIGATFAVGGCVLAAAYLAGGGAEKGFITGGIGLRAALIGAASAAALPRAARRLRSARRLGESQAKLLVLEGGVLRSFDAFVDTGNTLFEPVSGLPVAVIRCRPLERRAKIPVPAVTPAGRTALWGFKPERVSVNGREVDCVIALTRQKLPAEALIPPELLG
jgi:hypothetical protein